MSDVPQSAEIDAFVADARRQAEYEAERFPNDDWPPIVLALIKALDAAKAQAAEDRAIVLATYDQMARWTCDPRDERYADVLAETITAAQNTVTPPGQGQPS